VHKRRFAADVAIREGRVAAVAPALAGLTHIGKEDILGLVAALRSYTSRDEARERARQDQVVEALRASLTTLHGVEVRVVPDDAGRAINRLGLVTTPGRARDRRRARYRRPVYSHSKPPPRRGDRAGRSPRTHAG
jgi:hypothetical protein